MPVSPLLRFVQIFGVHASTERIMLIVCLTPRFAPRGKFDVRLRLLRLYAPHFFPGGGGNGIVAHKQNPMETNKGFPVPCFTLLARRSLASQEAVEARKKPADMKSVDRTAYAYKKKFSALVGEDWIAHVDALETHRANKFQWTARQFYYGLLHTLLGRAERTATAMEEDVEEVNLLDVLPDWFECEMLELRLMVAGKLRFSQLKPRTKVAVLITYFEEKFQRDTADLAEERFRFAVQGEKETIESWGQRQSSTQTHLTSV